MLTGDIRNKVDQIWNTFWAGGISNPLSVIEQITYLLFAKRLDDLQLAKEAQANLLNQPIEDSLFDESRDHLRWSRFIETPFSNYHSQGVAGVLGEDAKQLINLVKKINSNAEVA